MYVIFYLDDMFLDGNNLDDEVFSLSVVYYPTFEEKIWVSRRVYAFVKKEIYVCNLLFYIVPFTITL